MVAALGGDGTVSEAASGLVGSPTPLACVPAGVTNVFARAIGMPNDPLAAADRLVERERAGRLAVRATDVGTVNGRHFLYTAGVGFTAAMAETAERAPDRKARLGQLHFAATGLGEIARRYLRRPPEMEVEAGELRDRAVTVVVQNCEALTYFGPRQVRLCERAGLGTGALSLMLLRRTRPGDVATVIARLLAGGTGAVERHPQVRSASGLAGATVRGKGLPVDADGEFLGTYSEVVFGVEPGAVRRQLGRIGHELELGRLQPPDPPEVLAHVAGPLGDDPAVGVAVPGVALQPGGAGEAPLHLAVRGRLDLGAHGQRRAALALELDRLPDVAGLRLQVGDDRAAGGVGVGPVHHVERGKAGHGHAEVGARAVRPRSASERPPAPAISIGNMKAVVRKPVP